MTAFAARVLRDVRVLGAVRPGTRVGVAVSGGPDSVALLLVLLEIAPSLQAAVTHVIHVNHGLRGANADADAEYVAGLASRLGLSFVGMTANVRDEALRRGCSLEAAGHALRAAAYASARQAHALDVIATGHTEDDQAETLLLRLLRGASSRGLRGLSPVRPGLVRPLLGVSRRAIDAYLQARGEDARIDVTNTDRSIPRNRVRHDLLPMLARDHNPRIRTVLATTARLLAEDEDLLRGHATSLVSGFEWHGEALTGPRSPVTAVARPIRRRIAASLLERLGVGLSATRVEWLADQLSADGDGAERRGLVRVERTHLAVYVSRDTSGNRPRPHGIEQPAPESSLDGPDAHVQFGAWQVASRTVAGRFVATAAHEATLDAAAVRWPLRVRTPRPGDRIRPLGSPGRRKLQDLFVDRKVPRAARGGTPVVVDAAGRIVWVVGHVVAHDARVTETTARVLLLTARPVGGGC